MLSWFIYPCFIHAFLHPFICHFLNKHFLSSLYRFCARDHRKRGCFRHDSYDSLKHITKVKLIHMWNTVRCFSKKMLSILTFYKESSAGTWVSKI
jgi:hypothetical protein